MPGYHAELGGAFERPFEENTGRREMPRVAALSPARDKYYDFMLGMPFISFTAIPAWTRWISSLVTVAAFHFGVALAVAFALVFLRVAFADVSDMPRMA
ncbi:MAG: hypothetical protein NVS4B3_18430 [Gemmatimonadaceae bacterium]